MKSLVLLVHILIILEYVNELTCLLVVIDDSPESHNFTFNLYSRHYLDQTLTIYHHAMVKRKFVESFQTGLLVFGNYTNLKHFLSLTKKSLILLHTICVISKEHSESVHELLKYEGQLPMRTMIVSFKNNISLANDEIWIDEDNQDRVMIKDKSVTNKKSHTLRVATFHYPPFIKLTSQGNGSVIFPEGIEISIIKTIAEKLDMKPEFKTPNDGFLWGEPSKYQKRLKNFLIHFHWTVLDCHILKALVF